MSIEKDMYDYQFKNKYLKYKKKYQILKEQQAGNVGCKNWYYFFCFEPDFTGHWIDPSIPVIKKEDFDSLDKFKKKVVYKAYELNSSGVGYSTLGLSYYQGLSNIEPNYDGIINKTLGFSFKGLGTKTITKTKNTKMGANVNNLDLFDPNAIMTINSELISGITYKTKFLNNGIKKNNNNALRYPSQQSGTTSKPVVIEVTNSLIKPPIKIHRIVSFYGNALSEILEVKYENINMSRAMIVKEIVPMSKETIKELYDIDIKPRNKLTDIFKFDKIDTSTLS